MATTEQIMRTRTLINDTDSNHYAFTDSEIEDWIDLLGSSFRAAIALLNVIAGSSKLMETVFRTELDEGYEIEVIARTIRDRVDLIKELILSEEDNVSIYEEDDDRWTWNWRSHLSDMITDSKL